MTRRIQARDRTTLILSYTTSDANSLRALAQSISLKADKKPSLSLLSRRALELYGMLLRSPKARAAEIDVLNRMTTAVPKPATVSKRQPA